MNISEFPSCYLCGKPCIPDKDGNIIHAGVYTGTTIDKFLCSMKCVKKSGRIFIKEKGGELK